LRTGLICEPPSEGTGYPENIDGGVLSSGGAQPSLQVRIQDDRGRQKLVNRFCLVHGTAP